jgi:hypothetical protein
MRLIALGILSIQEPTRCIKTWRRVSSGQEWREKLWSMCQKVTRIEESRLIIWGEQGICSPWAFPSGNGKTFAWTSLWVCPTPRVGTTRYGSLWTISLSQLTLYSYPPHTGSDNMLSSIYHTLFAIMVSQRSLSLAEGLSSWHIFGNGYMSVLIPISSEAQLIIFRLTARLREWTKSLKTCFTLVFWMMVWSGTNIFHWQSSPTITVTKRALSVTFWSTLWMTLSYATELVWVRRESCFCPRYHNRVWREGEANSCQHLDSTVPSKELHRRKASCLGIWSWWSCIPSSFLYERCMSL